MMTVSLQSLRRLAPTLDARLLAEWQSAFRQCLPASLRRWLLSRDRSLIIRPVGARADLYRAIGEEREAVGSLDLAGPRELPPVGDSAQSRRQRIVLIVPAEQVLRRTVTFPLQVRENLAQVMRYELDRLSPFSSEQVCFDFQARPSGRSDRLAVELALCRRDQIQPWLERLRALGRPVDELTWEGAWPRANLLAQADRPSRRMTVFTVGRLSLVLALLLGVAVLVSPLWQREQILERREAELRRLRQDAIEVDEVRRALETAREGSVAVLRQKAEQARMVDLLRELTQSLPDHTWIQSLDVRGSTVQLRGESAEAATLIELLERAPGVAGVTFRSPVTQVARTGRERFNIAFEYARQTGS